MKLMTDLKNLSLQDKNGDRRQEELDIVEKKSLKEKCLSRKARETNCLVNAENAAFGQIV